MTNNKEKYTINYQGLSIGNHEFEFDITDALFKNIEESEIVSGLCKVHIILEKGNNLLQLTVNIKGNVELTCDRCLDTYIQNIDSNEKLTVKFSRDISVSEIDTSKENDILWINPDEGELDLTQYMYENICLSLPLQHVHPTDAEGNSMCDKDMLSRFFVSDEQQDDDDDDDLL